MEADTKEPLERGHTKVVHTSVGKVLEELPESKSVVCKERSIRNLGDPLFSSLFFERVR